MVEGISVFDLIENVRKKDDKGVEKDSEKTLIDRRVEELKNSSYHVCSFEKDSDDWSDAREMATVITKIIDEDGEKERDRILKAFDNMTEGVSNAIDRHPSHYTLEEEIPEDVCDRLIHTMVAIYEGLGVPVYDLILDENEYQYDSSDRVFRNNFDNLNNPELIIDDFYRKVKRDEVSSIEEDFFSNSHETIQDYPTLTRYKNKKTGETAYVLGNGIPDDCEKIDLFSNEEISLITKEVKNHLSNEQLYAE